jgi:hypothetical protein
MILKVHKSWLNDGTIVLTVKDHSVWITTHGPGPTSTRRVKTLNITHLPRGTPKADVRRLRASLKLMAELRADGV